MPPLDVIGYSNANVDILLKVEKLPAHDEKIKGKLLGKLPGGTMANYACMVSKLGLKAGWTGTIGQDQAGQLLVADFIKYQVDVSTIRQLEDVATMFAVIMIDHTGERSIIVVPSFYEPALNKEQQAAIAQARLLYTGPYQETSFLAVAKWARQNDTLVAIDVELTAQLDLDEVKEICINSNIVIFNQAVIKKLYNLTYQEFSDWLAMAELLQKLVSEYQLNLAGITLGSNGCILVNRDHYYKFPGFKIEVIDTTAAGDCFNAALTTALLRGWELEKAGFYANAAGALATQGYGARGYLPGQQAIKDFLKERDFQDSLVKKQIKSF